MPKSKRTVKEERGYSFNEYLKKYRPNPLPESSKRLPVTDDFPDRLANEALNRVREGLSTKGKRS